MVLVSIFFFISIYDFTDVLLKMNSIVNSYDEQSKGVRSG